MNSLEDRIKVVFQKEVERDERGRFTSGGGGGGSGGDSPKGQSKGKAGEYKVYHSTYSGAVSEALDGVERAGYKVDEDDFFNKVTSGPRKPSEGKTNSVNVDLEGTKKRLHMQVYNTGKSFELNYYIQ
jgi:hypothetical protein